MFAVSVDCIFLKKVSENFWRQSDSLLNLRSHLKNSGVKYAKVNVGGLNQVYNVCR